MSKNNWTTSRKFKTAWSATMGFIVGILIKIESLLSLVTMINADTATWKDYLVILIPIIFSILFLGFYWLYLKIIDWKQDLLERVDILEEETKGISGNEEKIKQIENNLLIQNSVNFQVAKHISELDDIDLEKLFRQCDKKHIEFILNRNNQLSETQSEKILSQFKTPIKKFHEPY